MSGGRRVDVTKEGLRRLIIKTLAAEGMGADYIEGYLDAQERSGWLKPGAPQWLRNSAAFYLKHAPERKTGPTQNHRNQ